MKMLPVPLGWEGHHGKWWCGLTVAQVRIVCNVASHAIICYPHCLVLMHSQLI